MISKKVLSLALAFVLSFSFVFFLPLNYVSADLSFPLPDVLWKNTFFTNIYPNFDYELSCSNFYSSFSQYDPEDTFLVFGQGTALFPSNSCYVFVYSRSAVVSSSGRYLFLKDYPVTLYYTSNFINYSDYNGNLHPLYPRSVCFDTNNDTYYFCTLNSSGGFEYAETNNISLCIVNETFKSFQPDPNSYQLTGFIVGSDTSMEAFYNWIIDNNKLSELPSYIVSSKLKSLLDFYHNYGGSLTGFIHYLPQWLSYVSLPSQTTENANILKNKLDALYSEFINQYKVTVGWGNSAQAAHHRNAINTKTDDSDLTLVTDDANDDVITSILRDILRGVIAIPTTIYNGANAIIEKLDGLSFTTTVVNNGGVPSGTDINPLLNKMDDIIEALGSDTVSVEIDQNTMDDTDQFFDDWNLEFQTALDDKFPVASQLSTLFTDFWEKCGVDVDNDGETFEYYNPGVLESRSEVRSLDSSGTSESDIVTDFLNKFDDSDPAFLDDASFNSVPDFSISIGGSDVSIFDFRVYAKYRDKIHFIISLVIWSFYLLHLYKALPTIIGQVADVAVKITDD